MSTKQDSALSEKECNKTHSAERETCKARHMQNKTKHRTLQSAKATQSAKNGRAQTKTERNKVQEMRARKISEYKK